MTRGVGPPERMVPPRFVRQGCLDQLRVEHPTNGVYVFAIKGDFTVNGVALNQRDGMGVWDVNEFALKADSNGAEVLLMEIPMQR